MKHLLLVVSLAAASCLAACAGGAYTPTGCRGASGGSGTALGNVAGGGTSGGGLGGVAGGGC